MKNFKKIVAGCLMVVFLFSIVSCQSIKPPLERELSYNTENVTESKTSRETEKSTTRYPLYEEPTESCEMIYYMETVRDFSKYLQTGSRNYEDYEGKIISPSLSAFPDPKDFMLCYIPLEDMFELTDQFHDTTKNIGINFAGTSFSCYTETMAIQVKYAPGYYNETTSKNMLDYKTISNDTIVLDRFSEKDQYGQCYIDRSIANVNLLYWSNSSIPRQLEFIMGNYKFKIMFSVESGLSKEGLNTAYHTFQTSEATAPFAALFSEDDAVVEQALKRIASAIEAKEASIKASAN